MSEGGKPPQGGKIGIPPDKLQEVMSNPAVMSAITERLTMALSEMKPLLPLPVRRRVRALKGLQLQYTKLEAQFYAEVQQLEAKYMALYRPLFDKRRDILVGAYEPTDEESHWSADEDEDEEEVEKEGEKEKEKEKEKEGEKESQPSADGAGSAEQGASGTSTQDQDAKGIPDFWLTALKNADIMGDLIKEHDEPLLKHLTDVKVVYLTDAGMDFRLEFHFSENEYFSNKMLSKSYEVTCRVDDEAPFNFEGATIVKGKGCKIEWKKGKNLTVKTVKKKQKHKGRGQSRTITKTVPNETFFNIFSPPESESKDSEEEEEEVAQALAEDYARAEFLRDQLLPKAVLFFTGELPGEDEEFEDVENEVDDDDEDEDDYDPRRDVARAKPECSQQ